MGQGLYASEPVFRGCVDACAKVLEDRLGVDLTGGFRGSDAAKRVHDNERRSFLTHGLLQIALVELWRSKGVRPDAVVGLSLGEFTSAVVAEALTPAEAITAVQAGAQWDERLVERGQLITLHVDLAAARRLCREAPVPLDIVAEYGPSTNVVLCQLGEVERFCLFLDNLGTCYKVHRGEFGYHTDQFATCKQTVLSELAHLRPQRTRVTYYSSFAAGLLPDTARLDSNFWYWMVASPVFFNSAFEAALQDEFDLVLSIGPHPSLDGAMREAAMRMGRTPEFLSSLRDDQPEVETFAATLARLRELGLAEPVGSRGSGAVRDLDRLPPAPLPNLGAQGRRDVSVQWRPATGRWAVLGYEEVAAALREPNVFSSELGRDFDPVLIGAEPEQHARARKVLAPNFKLVQAPAFAEAIGSIVDTALDESGQTAEPFDLVRRFALPVAERTAARFMGLDAAQTAEIVSLQSPNPWNLEYTWKLPEFFARQAVAVGSDDSSSLASRLIGRDGEGLTPSEALSVLSLIWVAGTTTAAMLIAASAAALLYDPAVRAEVAQRPELIPSLIEEALRLQPPGATLPRRTTAETSLGGVTIPAGAIVALDLGAANRDPDLYDEPETFHLHRPRKAHLSFGAGIHQCIGAGMARLTAKIAIEHLLGRFPDARPAIPVHRLIYDDVDHIRALTSLPCWMGPEAPPRRTTYAPYAVH